MIRSCLLALVAMTAVAHADMSGTIGNGSLTITDKLWLHENNNPTLQLPQNSPTSQWQYFNLAACVCSQFAIAGTLDAAHMPWYQGSYSLEIDAMPDVSTVHRPLQIWVGTNCSDPIMRPMLCHQVLDPDPGITDIASQIGVPTFIKPEVPVYDLMVPAPNSMGCEPQVLDAAEWAIADSTGSGTFDYFISNAIQTDSMPPPLPSTFSVESAENAIQIGWTAATGNVSDIAYYQALCADSSGNPAKSSAPAPRYVTPRNLCGAAQDLATGLVPTDNSNSGVDAGNGAGLPTGLAQLDPSYICAESADATATSLRIEGLKNGEPYTVVLLAIDKFGNAAGTYFTSTITPQPVVNFWEDLHDRGSNVQGGFCLFNETFGDDTPITNALRGFRDDNAPQGLTDFYYAHVAPLGEYVHDHLVLRILAFIVLLPIVLVAIAWHYLTLPGLVLLVLLWKLRRRIRIARLVPALVMLAPLVAHAQAPYWEDPLAKEGTETTALADREDNVRWHVGIKIGPYIPQIDAQLGGPSPGPYEQMFGSKASWIPVLDVDRVIWHGFGQVTIGGTIAYMSKTAHAFVMGSDPTDPNRPRSPGDSNTFRLLPFAVLASYRLTTLDDDYGIPLVPYARGGLSYYVWEVIAPNGDAATISGSNKALGATLGVQGAVGLQIRAERIDENAARSMHASGIEHAGFYGEFQAAKVDGFGSSKKLSVGDNTWFAGVDFEF